MGSFIDSETPRKPYKEVKSEYIKDKIRQTDFENTERRKYINNLVLIEEVILGNITLKFGSGQAFKQIKNRNNYEYDQIHKELKPEKYREKKLEEYQNKLQRENGKKKQSEKKIEEYRVEIGRIKAKFKEKTIEENKEDILNEKESLKHREQWKEV